MSGNIEVEVRSFISEPKYQELSEFFKKEGYFLGESHEESYYFDAPVDLRIQRNNSYSKIWLKKGKIHDEQREEIEVKFPPEDFENLEKMFLVMGYKVQIKWFRTRQTFLWQGVNVMVDYTKGYGHILELEVMSREEEKNQTLETLRDKIRDLGIVITSKAEFEEKYNFYKVNWQELIK